jgi:anthranilate 1,2-dioxygenase small subunit
MDAAVSPALPAGLPPALLDRLRVEAFLASYARCIDDDRLEEWPDFFVEDCRYTIIPRENHDAGLPIPLLLCVNRRMLRDRVLSHREANIYAPHVYRHFFSALVVTRERAPAADAAEDATLHALCNYLVIQTFQEGDSVIYQAGRCFDRFVETPQGLKIAERRVVYDTSRVQTLLTRPI